MESNSEKIKRQNILLKLKIVHMNQKQAKRMLKHLNSKKNNQVTDAVLSIEKWAQMVESLSKEFGQTFYNATIEKYGHLDIAYECYIASGEHCKAKTPEQSIADQRICLSVTLQKSTRETSPF